jgi:2-polyprenyl-6-methoxyphenol hydroxylase-like FAD-dependent oxidoreductase
VRDTRPLDGDYLIAADGSRSDVRAALGIEFEGEDYPDKILRVMTTDDLDALLPASRRSRICGTG